MLFELLLKGGLRLVLFLLLFGVGLLEGGEALLMLLVLLLRCLHLLAVQLCGILMVLSEGGEFTVQIIWSLIRNIIIKVILSG